MSKILTISVAAYNVEPYIKENIESILASKARDDIEIFVVDDGGKDGTYEIAKGYEEKYPDIVHAVHKENGGYGSVQNYSIAHATGKYFKILDGDDWMDTEGLTKLVDYLRTSDVDAVVTNYKKGPDKGSLSLFDFSRHIEPNEEIDPNSIDVPIGMWALVFKTDVLRKSGVVLPEHILYTDRIYSTVPFTWVKKLVFLNIPVYCYRTGREGQSVSRESRIKHIDEYLSVTETMCRHYTEDDRAHKEYLILKAASAYKVTIRALLLLDTNEENKQKLVDYESRVKEIAPDVYKKAASLKTRMGWVITFLRATGYRGYAVLGKVPKGKIDY
ncbi:Glycosyl transferase family 2 [Lachnospiraceae bacterium NE2001]|nr:Glycosyl transferase family 2 [Lachnospiraceae bacterium NE2001]